MNYVDMVIGVLILWNFIITISLIKFAKMVADTFVEILEGRKP